MKILIILFIVLILIWAGSVTKEDNQRSSFGADDQNYALAALQDLDEVDFLNNRIPEVPTDYLARNAHKVHMILEPPESQDGVEKLSFSNPVNTESWPFYRYTNPYQGKSGGIWAPNLMNRINEWQPGFETSGWSLYLRPGVSYDRWARNRWVRQNNRYYYINNGTLKDRLKDFTGRPS